MRIELKIGIEFFDQDAKQVPKLYQAIKYAIISIEKN
jgi:hypothetical protein